MVIDDLKRLTHGMAFEKTLKARWRKEPTYRRLQLRLRFVCVSLA